MSTAPIGHRRKLLTIEEAAEYMNVSPRFIRDRRGDGKLRAVKLGGLLRFDPDDIDRYIDASRESGGSVVDTKATPS